MRLTRAKAPRHCGIRDRSLSEWARRCVVWGNGRTMNQATKGGDSALFAAATDAENMRAIIAEHLRAPGHEPVDVVACEVTFARGRGPRSLFQYDVTLRD